MKFALNKTLLGLAATLIAIFMIAFPAQASQARYPISQLGNCRDAKECFYYCQIPGNFPACWSYSKFILNRNVLGDSVKSPEEIDKEHGVTFPIAELGNCSSPETCMQYCNLPANEQACTDFGRKKGLIQDNSSPKSSRDGKVLADAKQMLGCDSREVCMQYCNNPAHQQICEQFAEKEGFSRHDNQGQNQNMPQITTNTMEQELGCASQSSCMDFCNHPENYGKCEAFAEKYHLNSGQQSQSNQQIQPYQSNMSTPPCTDQQSCLKWCKDNPDKCHPPQESNNQSNNQVPQPISPYPSFGVSHSNPTYYLNQSYQQNNYQPPCTDEQSCNLYCQAHPTQCPGYTQNNSSYQNNGNMTSSQPTAQQSQQPASSYQPQQTQSIPPQPSPSAYTTSQQQQMCSQTPGCSWTGSTCSCSGY